MKVTIRQSLLKLTAVFIFLGLSQLSVALPQVQAVNGVGFVLKNDGRTIIFHGVNEMNKSPPSYEPSKIGFNQTQAQFIQQHGFNLVRLGVFWAAIQPTAAKTGQAPAYDDNYLNNIKQTIITLANQGIYTFIDFHQDAYSNQLDSTGRTVGLGEPTWTNTAPSGYKNVGFPYNLWGGAYFLDRANPISTNLDQNYTGFWSSSTLLSNYTAMVQHTVQVLKGTPGLIGYEIMNEPFPGMNWRNCASAFDSLGIPTAFANGCAVFEQSGQPLATLYQQVIPVINRTDPDALVLFEPVVFVDYGSPIKLPTFTGSNLVLSYHNYDTNDTTAPFSSAATYAAAAGGLPQIMSEFGGVNGPITVSDIAEQADTTAQSWTYWAYSNNPIYKFVPGAPDPTKQGIVMNMNEPLDTPGNVNTDRLNILTRPYPQIISGHSFTFAYDRLTHAFTMSYTTGMNDLQRSTQIFLPQAIYGTNYKVEYIQGRTLVVPLPAGPQILLLKNIQPGQVSIKVTPNTQAIHKKHK